MRRPVINGPGALVPANALATLAQLEPWHWRYGSKRSTAQVLAKLHATIQRAERPERRFLECIGRLPCVDTKAHAERHEDGEDVRDSLAKQPREQLCCVCGC